MEPWEEAANIVAGAYRLELSSMANPTHPRNLGYHTKFMAEPLRYAVLLLDRVQELEAKSQEVK